MSYYLAPCLKALTNEVNKLMAPPTWPAASLNGADGWIGDASHAARKSDHNPDYSAGGVVRAVDIGIQGRDVSAILKAVIGDPRIWYVIHNRKIYSRTYDWAARAYYGSNPHKTHIHVSCRPGKQWENDTSQFFETPQKKKRRRRPTVDLSTIQDQFYIGLGHRKGKLTMTHGVKVIQRELNRQYGAGLKVDGYVGPKTGAAWRNHEKRWGGRGRKRVPDVVSMETLASVFRWKK